MPAINFSTQRDIVKELQGVVEGSTYSTYGVVPTDPAFLPAGRALDLEFDYTPEGQEVRKLGTEGRVDSVKVGESGTMTFRAEIVNGTLLKWAFNAAGGGAGTCDESRAFYFSRRIAGTERYYQFLGCLPIAASVNIPNRGNLELSITVFVKSVVEDTTGPTIGSGSRATAETSAPWSHLTGGAAPLTINSVAYEHRGVEFSITRELAFEDAGGTSTVLFAKNAVKTITMRATLFKSSNALSDDARAHTKRNGTMVVGTLTGTLTGIIWKSDPEDHQRRRSTATVQVLEAELDEIAFA